MTSHPKNVIGRGYGCTGYGHVILRVPVEPGCPTGN
jgi:hypothetical protein